MELIQQVIAGVVVVGGGGTLVYYSIGKSGGISIEKHVKSQNRSLVSSESEWKVREDIYKKLDEKHEEIISGVENKDSTKTKVWMKIRNWCEKTKHKMFTGYEDKTYQSFSQWCLEKIDIKVKLTSEGLEDWSEKDEKMTELADEFNDSTKNSDSGFITGTGNTIEKSTKKKVTKDDLKGWCTTNKSSQFKHEMDQTYSRVKRWCFERKETAVNKEIKSTNQ